MGQSHSHSKRSPPPTSLPPPSSITPALAAIEAGQEEPLPPARPRPRQRKQSVARNSLAKFAQRASRLIRPEPEPIDSSRRSRRFSDYIFGTDPNDEFGEFGLRNRVDDDVAGSRDTRQKKDKGKAKAKDKGKGKGKGEEQTQQRQDAESSSAPVRDVVSDHRPLDYPSGLTLTDNDEAEALHGARNDTPRLDAIAPEDDTPGGPISRDLADWMSGHNQPNEEPLPRTAPSPPPAASPQTHTAPRAFPPPGTLMVVQGVVHTSDTLPPPPPSPPPSTPLTALRNRLVGQPHRANSMPASSSTPSPLPSQPRPVLTEQEEAAAHINSVDVLSALLGVATAATAAALVTGSTEPLFGASAAASNMNNSQTDRTTRRQGLWDNLRERVGRRRAAAGGDAEEQGTVEATQNLLTEMANILMGRQEEANGQPHTEASATNTTPAVPVHQQQAVGSETSIQIPSPNTSSPYTPTTAATAGSTTPTLSPSPSPTPLVPGLTLTPAPLQPDAAPSENFDTFLRQLQADLRVALMDSYAARRRARTGDFLRPGAIVPPSDPSPTSPGSLDTDSNSTTVPLPVSEADLHVAQPNTLLQNTAGGANEEDGTAPLSPPTIEITPPPPSSTQPDAAALGALNWWRLFRFPPMVLQAPTDARPGSSTSLPTSQLPAGSPEDIPSARVEGEGEGEDQQEPKSSSSSSPALPTDPTSSTPRTVNRQPTGRSQADPSPNTPVPTPYTAPQIVPVIIVGLRSVPAEQASLLSPPPPPAQANDDRNRGRADRGVNTTTSDPLPPPSVARGRTVDPHDASASRSYSHTREDDEISPSLAYPDMGSAPATPRGPSAFQWPRAARALGRHLGGNRNRHSMIEGSNINEGDSSSSNNRSRTQSLFGPASTNGIQRQRAPSSTTNGGDVPLPFPRATTTSPDSPPVASPHISHPSSEGRLPTRPATAQESTPSITPSPTPPTAPGGAGRARGSGSSYVIWVIGGYYPLDHPLVTGADNVFDTFENMWDLADLLGQVKPPVATSDEIAKSGLEIIKASDLEAMQKCGKAASNTLERCLICLDEYESEDEIRLMKCRHFFHKGCVDRWMEQGKNNCPACRSKGVRTAGDAMEDAASAAVVSPTLETPAMSPA